MVILDSLVKFIGINSICPLSAVYWQIPFIIGLLLTASVRVLDQIGR